MPSKDKMKRAVLLLAAIAFLIIPLMLWIGVPMREGFVTKVEEGGILTSISNFFTGFGTGLYNFFIGTDTLHIIMYVVVGVVLIVALGYAVTGSNSADPAQPILPSQAGGKRRPR